MKITSHWKSEYVTIPDWAIDRERRDLASVITAICLAGFEGKWIRLTAAQQRDMMGKAYFGKRHICASPSSIKVYRKVCFGMDCDGIELDSEEWAKMIARGYIC